MNAKLAHSGLRIFATIATLAATLSADSRSHPQPGHAAGETAEFHFVRLVYSGDALRFGGRERCSNEYIVTGTPTA